MIEGSDWPVPVPLTMNNLEANIRALYPRTQQPGSSDVPAYHEMFQKYREVSGLPGAETDHREIPRLIKIETHTILPATLRRVYLPQQTDSIAEMVSHHTDRIGPAFIGEVFPSVIVPESEMALRGQTREHGHTELTVCRFRHRVEKTTMDLYTLFSEALHQPFAPHEDADDEFDLESLGNIDAFIDRVPPSFIDLIRSIQPYR